MATKYPPPTPPFIAARHKGGRQTPKAIVLHGTVSSDNAGTARNIARWWNGPTSPVTSCHYVVDPKEVIQTVGDHTVAYHCGYNTGSIGIEFCDEQTGPATRWKDADSTAILKRAARLTAELCLAYGIAVARPTTAQLKAKGPHGIYSHNDSRLAFGRTTHTDPRDFPWAKFLRLVKAEVANIKAEAAGVKQPPKPAPAPAPAPAPKRETYTIRAMHASMLYRLTKAQHRHDARAIFARAKKRNLLWVTGTEAGEAQLWTELVAAAKANGYTLHRSYSNWIAVRKNAIKKGTLEKGSVFVMDNDKVVGPGHHSAFPWVTFTLASTGDVISVAAAHYPTKGRTTKDPNHWVNKLYAEKLGEWAKEKGKGGALAFVGGDFNMPWGNARYDVFFGQALTSLQDELKKVQGTGHGPIDGIASYDRDGRVKAKNVRVLNDRVFFIYGDHFPVEGAFTVDKR